MQKVLNKISTTVQGAHDKASNAVILTLAKAWIGIGVIRPAKTDDAPIFEKPAWLKTKGTFTQRSNSVDITPSVDRYDYTGLWSMQIGEYFMPLSQTFSLRAKKRLNVSSLVDGVDIIQQTRKEAKTLDCTLKLTLRDNQDNLKIVKDSAQHEVATLAQFLREFYDSDTVLAINNDMINNTFGVTHVFMSEYKFNPRVGAGTFTFDFSLTEVLYGENVLTFDLREVNSDGETSRQIGD